MCAFVDGKFLNWSYLSIEISDDEIRRWQNSPALADFHLPEVNRFIGELVSGVCDCLRIEECSVVSDGGAFQLVTLNCCREVMTMRCQ